MAAGDITIIGPLNPQDKTAIDTALTGQVVVADIFTSWIDKGSLFFAIVKAA